LSVNVNYQVIQSAIVTDNEIVWRGKQFSITLH